MEKRLQYIAEDINALLDKTEIAVDTEADRELMTNTPIARAGGLGRVVYVKATKKSYQYNIDTGEWVALPTSGVETDAEISSTSENPVQNKVISSALDKKVDKENGKGLSSNDFTNEDKNKLDSLKNYDDTEIRKELANKQDKLTDTQLLAVNSGITDAKVAQIATNATNIASLQTGKQDKLTAGVGITIQDNVISAKTSQPIYKHKLLINVTIGTYATTAIYNYLSNSSEVITDFTLVDDDFDIGASNASVDNLVKVFGIRVTKANNAITVKGTDSTFAELTGSATLGNDVVSQLV